MTNGIFLLSRVERISKKMGLKPSLQVRVPSKSEKTVLNIIYSSG
jgi:hypothetical protein